MSGPNKGEPYTCSACGGTFNATVDDSEAQEEFETEFGATIQDIPAAIVCDPCYRKMLGLPPAEEGTATP